MDKIAIKKIKDCIAEADDLIMIINHSDAILSIHPGYSNVMDNLYHDTKSIIQDRVDGWFMQAQAILDSIKGENNTIAKGLRMRSAVIIGDENFKEGQLRKITSGRTYLSQVLKAEQVGYEIVRTVNSSKVKKTCENNILRAPKIFISHSSLDKAIITDFVEKILQLGLNIPNEDIAFTSDERLGVEPGENIAKYIKENIQKTSVILVMLSKNYKESEVCMNEMGAAWALGKKCITVILPGTDFTELGWLTSLEKAVSIIDKEQLSRLCQTLAEYIPNIDLKNVFTAVSSKIDDFISSVVHQSPQMLKIGQD